MAAIPLTTLTQQVVGHLTNGRKLMMVNSKHTGTAGAGETVATIPLTGLKRIYGIPAFSIDTSNTTIHYVVSTTVSGTSVVVTVDSDVADGKYLIFSALVCGE